MSYRVSAAPFVEWFTMMSSLFYGYGEMQCFSLCFCSVHNPIFVVLAVGLGMLFFPHCSQVLDKYLADELSDTFSFENGSPEEQRTKRLRYYELKEEVRKAFSRDKAESSFALRSSSSSSSFPWGWRYEKLLNSITNVQYIPHYQVALESFAMCWFCIFHSRNWSFSFCLCVAYKINWSGHFLSEFYWCDHDSLHSFAFLT